eukprot:TRINITY_DN408_c0_g1_i7.p1 TRINITY_DN408_c0_g1~~TRINITY_DN408_c0_g1_i7.p1  ORF type:complete len:215 (-),score=53.11 TRINITY_DN408_c0_g1_i7:152-796(-)
MQTFLLAILLIVGLYQVYSAEVRVAHASPDAPAVDILVNGTLLRELTNIAFEQVSHYVFLFPGSWHFQVVPTGAKSPVVIDVTVDLNLITPYTIAATNLLANIKPILYTDDLRIPTGGRAAVRFIHLSSDAPAVDIAVKEGPTLFNNVAFGSATTYIQLNPGSYTLQVKISGTSTVALEVPATLQPERIYSIFAEGLVTSGGKTPLKAIISLDL